MVTLDDRLLGEKLQNYCSSSSEDEGDDGMCDNNGSRVSINEYNFVNSLVFVYLC
jgi:hypothetical protein